MELYDWKRRATLRNSRMQMVYGASPPMIPPPMIPPPMIPPPPGPPRPWWTKTWAGRPSWTRKTFYVCSYGGCGSSVLCQALSKYGNIEHIHSREPPVSLEYIGNRCGGNAYYEWFNGIKIPESELNEYVVIYIYKNPIHSIYSRFVDSKHGLKNIQCSNINYTLKDVIKQKEDLYNLKEFYKNYTRTDKDRNYKICCVKYQEMFEKQDELSKLLGIGKLNLIKKETKREIPSDEQIILNDIYKDLIDTMNNNDFISVI